MTDIPATSRLSAFAHLTEDEFALLKSLAAPPRALKRGAHVLDEGEETCTCYLLLDGWAASTITMVDGARQMIKVYLPGDMLALPGLALARAPDTIVALTPVLISSVPMSGLGRLFESAPRLAALLFLVSQEERVALMDRLASLGRSNALERLATLLLQIRDRLRLNNTGVPDIFDLPLRQRDLADLTGVTTVHLNRMLQQLGERGIALWNRRTVEILDIAAMRELSGLPPRTISADQSWLPLPR